MMKKIEAFIRPEKIDDVRKALDEKGFAGMTIIEAKGRGKQKGISLEWRVGEYRVEFLPKLKLEIFIKDEDTETVINTISEAAKTGEIGDGKIFVSSVDNAIRIRTGEKGEEAIY